MEKKKSILFLYGKLVGGGAERVLIDMLNNIDYTKYEVDLALVEKGGILLPQVPSEVNVIELWKKNSFHYFMAVKLSLHLHWNVLFSQRLNSNRLRKSYDLEIGFLEGLPSKLISLRKSKSKKISWIHVDIFNFPKSKSFFSGYSEERRVYEKMDEIICVSEDCRVGFNKRIPGMEEKCKVIYNPIDIKNILFKSESSEKGLENIFNSGKTNVVTVGRITGQKNPSRLIETALLAKKEGLPVKFIWIGEGELLPEMQKKIEEWNLMDTVEFIGFKTNPYPYISKADILLLPSDAEGFGLVLCEAMALGTPVISTRTAGPVEIIGENEYGLLADFSPETLFESIKRLIEDKTLYDELKEKGYRRVEDFSVEKNLSKLYTLIDNEAIE